jgi:hypothetical protein
MSYNHPERDWDAYCDQQDEAHEHAIGERDAYIIRLQSMANLTGFTKHAFDAYSDADEDFLDALPDGLTLRKYWLDYLNGRPQDAKETHIGKTVANYIRQCANIKAGLDENDNTEIE